MTKVAPTEVPEAPMEAPEAPMEASLLNEAPMEAPIEAPTIEAPTVEAPIEAPIEVAEEPPGLSEAKRKLFHYLVGYSPMAALYQAHKAKISGLLHKKNADGLITYISQMLGPEAMTGFNGYFDDISDELDFKTVIKELTKHENLLLVDALRQTDFKFANCAVDIPALGRKFIQGVTQKEGCDSVVQLEFNEQISFSGLATNNPAAFLRKPAKLTTRHFIEGTNWPNDVTVSYRPGYNKTSTGASVQDFLPPGHYVVKYQKAPNPATQTGTISFFRHPQGDEYQFQVRKSKSMSYVLEKKKLMFSDEKVAIDDLEIVYLQNLSLDANKITVVDSPSDSQDQRVQIFKEIAAKTSRLTKLVKGNKALFNSLVEYAILCQAQTKQEAKVPEVPPEVQAVLDEIASLSIDVERHCNIDELLLQCTLDVNFDFHLLANLQGSGDTTSADITQCFAAMELLRDAFTHIDAMAGKALISLLGETGSGKSTFINFLCGIPLHVIVDDKYLHKAIDIDSKALHEKEAKLGVKAVPATIGHKIASSETIYAQAYPMFAPPKKIPQARDVYACDTPGTKDTRGKIHDLAGRLSVNQAINGAKSIRAMVLILPFHSFDSCRGAGPIDLVAELKTQLPSLFSDPAPAFRQAIFGVISKHLDEVNVLEKVRNRIKGALKEEREKLDSLRVDGSASSISQIEHITERVQTWSFLNEVDVQGRLYCIDMENQKERMTFLDNCLNSPGIPRSEFQQPNSTQTKKDLDDTLEIAPYQLQTQVFDVYTQTLPLEIAQTSVKIQEIDGKLRGYDSERVGFESTIAGCEESIAKLHRRLEDLDTKKEDGDEAKAELERLYNSRLKAFELDDQELDKHLGKQREALKTNHEEIEVLKKQIEELGEMKQAKLDEFNKKRHGSTKIVLWPKRKKPEPNDDLHLINWKSFAVRQQAISEVRPGRDEDYDENSKKTVKCKDYTGSLFAIAHIAEEYRVVPEDEKERKAFLERIQNKGSSRQAAYEALIEGKYYELDEQPRAVATGKEIAYGIKTNWEAGRELPWVQITHKIPNHELHAAGLLNLSSDVAGIGDQIKKTVKALEEANKDEKKHQDREQALQNAKEKLKAERESFLAQAMDAARQSLASACRDDVKAERARIQAQQASLHDLEQRRAETLSARAQLTDHVVLLKNRKRQLALLISNQLPVINLLVRLLTLLAQRKLPSQDDVVFEARDTNQLYMACANFRQFYFAHLPAIKKEIEAEFGFPIAGRLFHKGELSNVTRPQQQSQSRTFQPGESSPAEFQSRAIDSTQNPAEIPELELSVEPNVTPAQDRKSNCGEQNTTWAKESDERGAPERENKVSNSQNPDNGPQCLGLLSSIRSFDQKKLKKPVAVPSSQVPSLSQWLRDQFDKVRPLVEPVDDCDAEWDAEWDDAPSETKTIPEKPSTIREQPVPADMTAAIPANPTPDASADATPATASPDAATTPVLADAATTPVDAIPASPDATLGAFATPTTCVPAGATLAPAAPVDATLTAPAAMGAAAADSIAATSGEVSEKPPETQSTPAVMHVGAID